MKLRRTKTVPFSGHPVRKIMSRPEREIILCKCCQTNVSPNAERRRQGDGIMAKIMKS